MLEMSSKPKDRNLSHHNLSELKNFYFLVPKKSHNKLLQYYMYLVLISDQIYIFEVQKYLKGKEFFHGNS